MERRIEKRRRIHKIPVGKNIIMSILIYLAIRDLPKTIDAAIEFHRKKKELFPEPKPEIIPNPNKVDPKTANQITAETCKKLGIKK